MQTYIIIFSILNIAALYFMYKHIMKKITQQQQAKKDDSLDKIFKLYQEIEGMMDSFEGYVREVHEEYEKKRHELTELSRKATTIYRESIEQPQRKEIAPVAYPTFAPVETEPELPQIPEPPKKEEKKYRSRLGQRDKNELAKQMTKPQKVRFLMSKGFSLDEVAKELNIGKFEVKLIADLDKT